MMAGVMDLDVFFYIHALMKNPNNYNFRVRSCTVKNDVAAMVIFSISFFYFVRMISKFGLTAEKFKASSSCFRYLSLWRVPQVLAVCRPISITSFCAELVSRNGRIR